MATRAVSSLRHVPDDALPADRIIALEEAFTVDAFHGQESALTGQLNPTWGRYVDRRIADLTGIRLEDMDRAGIDVQVLSLTSPGIQGMTSSVDAVRVAQEANDVLAAAVRAHPLRFAGLAALPCQDPAAAVAELERSVSQLGLKGALVNGHTDGVYLDDDRFTGLWEAVESLGVPLYLHPADPPTPFAIANAFPIGEATFGWGFETGGHLLRLVMGGVLERFPNVAVILGHMGELLPYNLARLDDRYDFYVGTPPIPQPPSFYIRRNVMITTSGVNDPAPLRCAIDVLGADRVMFAADYPYQRNEPAVEFIRSAPISKTERALICHGNAERLLRI
jgi:2,3-dihydroxybenzoate decarboxylase